MIRGVTFNSQTNKWRASMRGAGRRGYLGEFDTEDEATRARQAAELEVDGRVHDQASIIACGDEALVPLFARRGVLRGWSLIDSADVSLVSGSRWCLDPSGYAVARIGFRRPTMHIVLMPGAGVRDHISGDRLDNRRRNLRWCTARENSLNTGPTRNRALPKGVSTTPEGRFRARLMVNRCEIRLGHFDCAEEAARAYDAAALAHFGEFARLNFPTPGVDVRVAPLDVESDPTTPSTRSAA